MRLGLIPDACDQRGRHVSDRGPLVVNRHQNGDAHLVPSATSQVDGTPRLEAVHLRFGQYSTVVKNFRADLNSEKIRLESVNARFDPQ